MGDRWSIAWRLHDAQFWGVPQRRKRIALVADFGGKSAPEILFERESMSRDIEQGEQAREKTSGDIGNSTYQSAYTLKIRGGREIDSYGKRAGKGALIQTEKSGTLGVSQDQTLITVNSDKQKNIVYATQASGDRDNPSQSFQKEKAYMIPSNPMSDRSQAIIYGLCSDNSNSMKSSNPNSGIYKADTTRTLDNNGGNPNCKQGGMIIVDKQPTIASKASFFLKARSDGKSDTLVATDYKDPQIVCYGVDCYNQKVTGDKTKSLNSAATDSDHIPCIAIDRASFNQGKNAKFDFSVQEDIAQPLVARGPGGVLTQSGHCAQETTKE